MRDIRLGLPTVLMLLAVVAAGAFAAGSALPTAPVPPRADPAPAAAAEMPAGEDFESDPLPPGHPPTMTGTGGTELPAGHPAVDPVDPPGSSADPSPPDESPLVWKAPARWQLVPNPSSMRMATYRVPRAAGDDADAELSITRAGGSPEANADRWIGQFDAAAQKSAKRSVRKVGSLDVLVVEVQGTYSGAMGKEGSAQPGWALLGAIVSTPGMPHFFKLTGPARSVLSAHAEFDAMISGLVER